MDKKWFGHQCSKVNFLSIYQYRSSLLEEFKSQNAVAVLEIWISESFGSRQKANRMNIRQFLVDYYQEQLSAEEVKHILDLDRLPLSRIYSFSISHASDIGVLAVCTQKVGVDIESAERINPKIIERISDHNERLLFADTGFIWGIKEASYKSLSFSEKVNVVGDIKIIEVDGSFFKTEKTLGLFTEFDKNKLVLSVNR